MEKKNLMFFLLLFTVIILSPTLVQADLCRWQGYANKSNTLVNTTDNITVYNGSQTYIATIFISGMYTADVQAASDATVSFKICGVDAAQGGQAWSCPASDFNTLNLSITAVANGQACTYSCACSGGYCCSGATEYTAGEGSGTCQASACSAAEDGGAVDTGGGVSGGVTPTVEDEGESKTFTIIPPGGSGTFTVNDTDTFKIIEIIITVVGQGNNVKITIKAGSLPIGAPLPISEALGKVYKYLDITKGNISNANISLVQIKFKVAKTWLTNNNLSSDSVALQRYSAGSWTKLTTTKVDEDSDYYYYVAETNALSTFAITAEEIKEKVACPYECCEGEAEYIDKSCAEGEQCEVHTCKAPVVCEEDWVCDEWSECADGTQTRSCTDRNNCGTEEEKPTESQSCLPIVLPELPMSWIIVAVVALVIIVIVIVARIKPKKHRR